MGQHLSTVARLPHVANMDNCAANTVPPKFYSLPEELLTLIVESLGLECHNPNAGLGRDDIKVLRTLRLVHRHFAALVCINAVLFRRISLELDAEFLVQVESSDIEFVAPHVHRVAFCLPTSPECICQGNCGDMANHRQVDINAITLGSDQYHAEERALSGLKVAPEPPHTCDKIPRERLQRPASSDRLFSLCKRILQRFPKLIIIELMTAERKALLDSRDWGRQDAGHGPPLPKPSEGQATHTGFRREYLWHSPSETSRDSVFHSVAGALVKAASSYSNIDFELRSDLEWSVMWTELTARIYNESLERQLSQRRSGPEAATDRRTATGDALGELSRTTAGPDAHRVAHLDIPRCSHILSLARLRLSNRSGAAA
jgi:hypothetical protein